MAWLAGDESFLTVSWLSPRARATSRSARVPSRGRAPRAIMLHERAWRPAFRARSAASSMKARAAHAAALLQADGILGNVEIGIAHEDAAKASVLAQFAGEQCRRDAEEPAATSPRPRGSALRQWRQALCRQPPCRLFKHFARDEQRSRRTQLLTCERRQRHTVAFRHAWRAGANSTNRSVRRRTSVRSVPIRHALGHVCRMAALAECKGNATALVLDLYEQAENFARTGQYRFTPPIHVIVALPPGARGALTAEGGVAGRGGRCAAARPRPHRTGMRAHRLRGALARRPACRRRSSSPSACRPIRELRSSRRFYDQLENRGYAIYPGKLT